ncbi:DUF1822 family protein [Brunnivagina elsteri]|uniref:DUF1822 domain-containing protein n=1 Tax=Brunnivagina elsteri CCALA 953 TaxID=987040 RepID=A0A2A2THP4_9CYAN|nr:DUF1822 family protein [Calothrix elsteri]PAX52929.1 hypothetical protein CK510_16645 [Calothrix elsteri CCALA 953]
MSRIAYGQEDFSLSLPISQSALVTAQAFAQQQPTSEKASRVLFNTLSILTVNYYLDLMGIETNLSVGDSWNPVLRLCTDVSDLEVSGIGRLECRPMCASGKSCYIPPETWNQRAAYVVVMIDESLLEAKILGFSPSVQTEELLVSQLQPPEALTAHIKQYQQNKQPVNTQTLVNLSQWFAGVVENGWQTVESIFSQPEYRPLYLFRSSESALINRENETMSAILRGKVINLGIQIANQPVILIVELIPQENQKTNVRLQLHSTGSKIYLKSGIILTVLDELGNMFLEAQSRSADNYIQLQFNGEIGEHFSIRVGLDEASITEHFVI